MSGGFLCFRPRAGSPDPGPPPVRARGRVTFGSFNLPAKISPTTIALWAEILRRVPGARLILKGPAFAEAATRAAYQRRLAASPLAGHDVVLCGPLDDERDHLAAYGRIDIALDTWPYGGTTTTCEALWMGVPVVTLAGRSHASRVGASLLARLGEPALVADSPAGYVEAAVALATDPQRLEPLRVVAARAHDVVGDHRRRGVRAPLHRSAAPRLAHPLRSHARRRRADPGGREHGAVRGQPARGRSRHAGADHALRARPSSTTGSRTRSTSCARRWRAASARSTSAPTTASTRWRSPSAWGCRAGSGRSSRANAVAERLRASLAINGLPQAEVVAAAVSDREGERLAGAAARAQRARRRRPSDAAATRRGGRTRGGPGRSGRAGHARRVPRAPRAVRHRLRQDRRRGSRGRRSSPGGQRFFSEESPLVMFEVRPGGRRSTPSSSCASSGSAIAPTA